MCHDLSRDFRVLIDIIRLNARLYRNQYGRVSNADDINAVLLL